MLRLTRHGRNGAEPTLAAVLAALPQATLLLDEDGHVAEVNPAAERLLDTPADEAIGRPAEPLLAVAEARGATAERTPLDAGALVVLRPAGGTRLATVVDQSADLVVVTDEEGRIVEWNQAAADALGLELEEVRGRNFEEVLLRLGGTQEERQGLRRVLAGEVFRYHAVRRDPRGERLDLSVVASPLRDGSDGVVGIVILGRDVTALRAAERERDTAAARARFLAEASQILTRSLDLDRTLAAVGGLLVPDWADGTLIALREPRGTGLEAITVRYRVPELEPLIRDFFEEYAAHPLPGGMIERVLSSGQALLMPEYQDPEGLPPRLAGRSMREAGVRSLVVAPLRARGQVAGLLVALMTHRSDRRFRPEDVDLVQDVADRAAQAVDNARSFSAARAAEERFRAAFEDAPIGVALMHAEEDGTTRYAEVNPALCQILGQDRAALVGTASDLAVGEHRHVRPDGEERWLQVQSAPLSVPAGSPVAVIAQVQDVTDRRRFEHELEHLASHDPLTGVLNRRRFEEELVRAVAGVRRHGRPAAVVTIDLDNFKQVNDSYGHAVGDELLRTAARVLRERVRATDAVGRLGGDEFGVVLTDTGKPEAAEVADGLLAAFRERIGVEVEGRTIRVTASAGVRALDPSLARSPGEMLGEADMALYDAKERGRDRLSIVGDGDAGPERVRTRFRWRERIREALEHDRFVLYEQPILNLADGRIDRAELLLRMRSEVDGGDLVLPADFLPIAERYDHIRAIDRWVVTHSLALLAARQAAGSPVGASINLSGDSIGDASVVDFIVAEIRNAGVDPSCLTFEVTETTAIGNLDRARLLAQQLSALGCDFALDDFGAGFGSFSYLKHLPLDVIKIDGEFIRALPRSPQDQVTVRAIVDIAKGLGKQTVGEFVEDQATLELLRRLGVDRAQGFHIGRPRPATAQPSF